jgi:hypothetical protein
MSKDFISFAGSVLRRVLRELSFVTPVLYTKPLGLTEQYCSACRLGVDLNQETAQLKYAIEGVTAAAREFTYTILTGLYGSMDGCSF